MKFLLDRLIISENSDSNVIFLLLTEKSFCQKQFSNSYKTLAGQNIKKMEFLLDGLIILENSDCTIIF